MVETLTGLARVSIPYAALVVVWAVQLRARIKEIRRKGEETDAAAQY